MDTIKFGNLLKELRLEKKITQQQLAERFGVSNRTVSRWETGVNLPDTDLLLALSDFYGTDVRAMLNGERKTSDIQPEEKVFLRATADYCDRQNRQKVRTVLWDVLFGVLAAASEAGAAVWLVQNIKGGVIVFLIPVFLFVALVLLLRRGKYGKSRDGRVKHSAVAFCPFC